jgi:hypothetical protein
MSYNTYNKEQLLYLQSVLDHEQWEHFNTLGNNGYMSSNNDDVLAQDIIKLCKSHDAYNICKGWGESTVYTRMSFIFQGKHQFICLDNIVKIDMNNQIGKMSIMVDKVLYTNVFNQLTLLLNSSDNVNIAGWEETKFTNFLTQLNNLKQSLFINEKLIHDKLFINEYTTDRQELIRVNQL